MWKSAVVALVCASSIAVAAQGRGARTATLAIMVSDAEGKGIPAVLVTVEGPAERTARTEGGRIAFEKLPPGTYRIRFEHDRFVTLEKELNARAGAPTDVKVTLNPAPPPPEPPAPPPPPEPEVLDMKPAARDLIAIIEAEYVGRAPSRVSQVTCEGDVESTLIQLNEPLAQHSHEEAEEVFYVIAGAGTAEYGGAQHTLKPGTYLFVPRGTPHTIGVTGRNPLVLLSTRTGERCGAPQ